MRITKYFLLFLVFIHNISFADGLGIGVTVGSTGLGIEGRARISEIVFVRGGISGLVLQSSNYLSNDYTKPRVLQKHINIPIVLDLHPIPSSGLRFSIGVSYFDRTSRYKDSGGFIYTKIFDSIVEAENKNKLAPIVSFGYDSSAMGSDISFSCDFGVLFLGQTKIKKIIPGLETKAKEVEDHYRSKVRKLSKFYPIISAGLKFSL